MSTSYSVFIKIATQGAEKAAKELEKLAKASNKASLNTSKMSVGFKSASEGILKLSNGSKKAAKELEGVARASNKARLNTSKISSGFKSASEGILKLSNGSKKVAKELEGVARASNKARLNTSKMAVGFKSASEDILKLSNGSKKVAKELEGVARASNNVGVNTPKMSSGFKSASEGVLKLSEGSEKLYLKVISVASVMPILSAALPVAAIAGFVAALAGLGEEVKSVEQRLYSAGVPMSNMHVAFSKLSSAALESHSSLEDFSEVFMKVGLGLKEYGASLDQQIDATESFSLAMRAGATEGAQLKSSILELSHSFDQGAMYARQYNVLQSESKVLTLALSDNWKKATGSSISFAKAVKKGDVSSGALLKTLIAAKPELLEQATLFNRISFSITDMGTKLTSAAEKSDLFKDSSSAIAGVIDFFGDVLSDVVTSIGFVYDALKRAISPFTALSESFFSATEKASGFNDTVSLIPEIIGRSINAVSSLIETVANLGKVFVDTSVGILNLDFSKTKKDIEDLHNSFIGVSGAMLTKASDFGKGITIHVEHGVKNIEANIPEFEKQLDKLSKIGNSAMPPISLKFNTVVSKGALGRLSDVEEFSSMYASAAKNVLKLKEAYGGLTPSIQSAVSSMQTLANSVVNSDTITTSQVDTMRKYYEALNEEAKKPLLTFKTYSDFVKSETPSLMDITKKLTESFGSEFADSIISIQNGTESAASAFKKMAKSIIEDIEKMAIEMTIYQTLTKAMDFFGASSGAPSGITPPAPSILGSASPAATGLLASSLPPTTPRGLLGGRNTVRNSSSGKVFNIHTTVNNTHNSSSSQNTYASDANNAKLISKMVNNQIKTTLSNELRVGGMLHR